MLSRILWLGLAGIALIAGLILWYGNRFSEQKIKTVVTRAVESGVDQVPIVVIDARKADVSPTARRALDDAVGRLVKAETDLALLHVRHASDEARQQAEIRRNRARTEVETVEDQIERQSGKAGVERDAIRDEVREEVRNAVRDAVGD